MSGKKGAEGGQVKLSALNADNQPAGRGQEEAEKGAGFSRKGARYG